MTLLSHVLATYATSLVGAWKLNETVTDGTVTDYSGAGHHMTIANGTPSGATLLGDGSGEGSMIFGSGSESAIPSAAWMAGTSISMFARVKMPATLTSSTYGAIMAREDEFLFRRQSGTAVGFKWPGTSVQSSAGSLVDATVYSYGASFNGSTQKLYLNGAANGSVASSAMPLTSTKKLTIGNFGVEPFLGNIGPAYLWVGRDLTAAEHLDLHTMATTAPAPPGIPTSVAITGATETTLTLSWSAPASGGTVTFYEGRVNGAYAGHLTSPWTVGGLPSGGAPFTPGHTYNLEVRAVGPGGASAYVLVTGTTLSDYTLTFVATGLPMKINSAGTWIPVKALT